VTSHVKSTWSSPTRRRMAALVVAVVTATPLMVACSSSSPDSSGDPLAAPGAKAGTAGTVVVGSNDFAESVLIADLYGEALKAKGIKVSYKPDIGSRETTYGLLRNGSVTVLPEYNGALLAYLDARAHPASAAATDAAVLAGLDPELTLLESAPAQDKDSLTVNAATAEKYHLTSESTIADLAAAGPDIVIGGPPEFQTRYQGLEGLKAVYGLTLRSFKALDADGPLTRAALKSNNVQVADIFTTDPVIELEDFVVLRDPENLFGFENVVPLVHKSGLPRRGVDALNAVSAKLDTAALLDMDSQVQSGHQDPLDVATAWLKSVGLI
jgi:osmoprotectant transport system substrate-binding protein